MWLCRLFGHNYRSIGTIKSCMDNVSVGNILVACRRCANSPDSLNTWRGHKPPLPISEIKKSASQCRGTRHSTAIEAVACGCGMYRGLSEDVEWARGNYRAKCPKCNTYRRKLDDELCAECLEPPKPPCGVIKL